MLYQTTREPIFINEMAEKEQNILKWAALLHDVSKRGAPEINGKDHIHPFVSGAAVLEIFRDLGFIQLESKVHELEFDKVIQLIMDSKEELSKVPRKACRHRHSHQHLKQIFSTLWSPNSPFYGVIPRGGFVDLVFRLVFFHQSLIGLKQYPPKKSLSNLEKLMFCDSELYRLMSVLMVADSSSYRFFCDQEQVQINRLEFLQNNHMQVNQWMQLSIAFENREDEDTFFDPVSEFLGEVWFSSMPKSLLPDLPEDKLDS